MISALAKTFRGSRLPAVSATGLLATPVVATALDALEALRFERYELADRGAYEASDASAPADVESALVEVASGIVGRPLEVRGRRWYRLHAGDYSLSKDDRWARGEHATDGDASPSWFDLTLDLSMEPTGEAEVVFAHRGAAFFTVPQRLGEIGLVARGPTVTRFDRYLTLRVGDRRVDRLRLLLVERDTRSA